VGDPAISGIQNTVLEEDNLLSIAREHFVCPSWDSEELEDVAVAGGDAVLLEPESIFDDDLLKSLVEVWVCLVISAVFQLD
jgi:hypothetical protein